MQSARTVREAGPYMEQATRLVGTDILGDPGGTLCVFTWRFGEYATRHGEYGLPRA